MNVTANGSRMHYALEGPAGAPVVTLSHSLAARLEMWEPQVKALAGRWRGVRLGALGRGCPPPFREREPEVVERVRAMIRGTKPAGYIGCCRAIAGLDLTDRVGAIKLPTLVIVGAEDPGTPVAAARVLHERIKGSELMVLKSASHLSNLEQPDLFSGALTDFLRRVR